VIPRRTITAPALMGPVKPKPKVRASCAKGELHAQRPGLDSYERRYGGLFDPLVPPRRYQPRAGAAFLAQPLTAAELLKLNCKEGADGAEGLSNGQSGPPRPVRPRRWIIPEATA
jgi:hypothetical protein